MIAMVGLGVAFLVVIAVVVGIIDAVQAPAWREIAAERRRVWEDRQPRLVAPHDVGGDD